MPPYLFSLTRNSKEYAMTRLSLILVVSFSLAACATIQGAGRDLQSAGRAIEAEASKAQTEY